jgi:XRE family transcriptional regulator, regulator of sulfur utilization
MSDHTSTRLAANLRRLRELRGLTQQDLAQRSGVPRPTLAHLESGEANPTLGVMIRVAQALATNIEELISDGGALGTLYSARSLVRRKRGKAMFVELCPGREWSFERVELGSGARIETTPARHAGPCYVTCESGEFEVESGEQRYRLERGDVLVLPSEVGHCYRNLGRARAVLYSLSAGAALVAARSS